MDLSYVLLGTTKFGVQVTRDVQFSYDVTQPYYVQSGVSASIAQQIYGPVDAVAGGGLYSLAYRDEIGAAVPYADRTDRDRFYSGGVGYHMGKDLRVGVNVQRQWRLSEVTSRAYSGFKLGMSVTYGT